MSKRARRPLQLKRKHIEHELGVLVAAFLENKLHYPASFYRGVLTFLQQLLDDNTGKKLGKHSGDFCVLVSKKNVTQTELRAKEVNGQWQGNLAGHYLDFLAKTKFLNWIFEGKLTGALKDSTLKLLQAFFVEDKENKKKIKKIEKRLIAKDKKYKNLMTKPWQKDLVAAVKQEQAEQLARIREYLEAVWFEPRVDGDFSSFDKFAKQYPSSDKIRDYLNLPKLSKDQRFKCHLWLADPVNQQLVEKALLEPYQQLISLKKKIYEERQKPGFTLESLASLHEKFILPKSAPVITKKPWGKFNWLYRIVKWVFSSSEPVIESVVQISGTTSVHYAGAKFKFEKAFIKANQKVFVDVIERKPEAAVEAESTGVVTDRLAKQKKSITQSKPGSTTIGGKVDRTVSSDSRVTPLTELSNDSGDDEVEESQRRVWFKLKKSSSKNPKTPEKSVPELTLAEQMADRDKRFVDETELTERRKDFAEITAAAKGLAAKIATLELDETPDPAELQWAQEVKALEDQLQAIQLGQLSSSQASQFTEDFATEKKEVARQLTDLKTQKETRREDLRREKDARAQRMQKAETKMQAEREARESRAKEEQAKAKEAERKKAEQEQKRVERQKHREQKKKDQEAAKKEKAAEKTILVGVKQEQRERQSHEQAEQKAQRKLEKQKQHEEREHEKNEQREKQAREAEAAKKLRKELKSQREEEKQAKAKEREQKALQDKKDATERAFKFFHKVLDEKIYSSLRELLVSHRAGWDSSVVAKLAIANLRASFSGDFVKVQVLKHKEFKGHKADIKANEVELKKFFDGKVVPDFANTDQKEIYAHVVKSFSVACDVAVDAITLSDNIFQILKQKYREAVKQLDSLTFVNNSHKAGYKDNLKQAFEAKQQQAAAKVAEKLIARFKEKFPGNQFAKPSRYDYLSLDFAQQRTVPLSKVKNLFQVGSKSDAIHVELLEHEMIAKKVLTAIEKVVKDRDLHCYIKVVANSDTTGRGFFASPLANSQPYNSSLAPRFR